MNVIERFVILVEAGSGRPPQPPGQARSVTPPGHGRATLEAIRQFERRFLHGPWS
jgi:hypothetical protein